MGKALQAFGTEWRFTTPYALHQGGLWEAAVKSMKYHLRRVIGPHQGMAERLPARIAAASQVAQGIREFACG